MIDSRTPLVALMVLGATVPAAAMELIVPEAEMTTSAETDGKVELSGGIGVIGLRANEIVYAAPGSSNAISHLIWQSTAPTLTAGLDVRLPEGWTLALDVQMAMAGDSQMEDYDWFGPDFRSYDADEWTHRSQHPDTDLDWYFDGSMLVGRDVHSANGVTVNLNGGFKYTDVQWAAYGGSYVYSDFTTDNAGDNFRAYEGSFTDGEPAISYRQQLPALIGGLDLGSRQGNWSFSGSAHAGVTFGAVATDHHWMRDLVITDTLQPAPLISVSGEIAHAFEGGMTGYIGGAIEQVFAARADKEWVEGGVTIPYSNSMDSGGADLFAASISAGIKGRF